MSEGDASPVGELAFTAALDISDLLQRTMKHCDESHHERISQLPSDFLASFMFGVTRAYDDIQAGKETLSSGELSERGQEQARHFAERSIDEIIVALQPLLAEQNCSMTEEYRQELIQELLSGSMVECNALSLATNAGLAAHFFNSRRLADYGTARESVKASVDRDGRRVRDELALLRSRSETGEDFDTTELQREYEQRRERSQRRQSPAQRWRKAFFGESIPETITTFWLPFCLWCYDTTDAIGIMCDFLPGARLLKDEILWKEFEQTQRDLASQQAEAVPHRLSEEELLRVRDKSGFTNFNKGTFAKAMHDRSLWRSPTPHWSLREP